MRSKLFKLCIFFICFSVICSCTLSSAIFIKDDRQTVYDKTLRLHVLANSGSEQDQELKLKVRDEIVRLTSQLFDNCNSIDQAKKIALQSKDKLKKAAKNVIIQNGFDYDVDIQMGIETYPVRYYGDFIFPAGDYFSLRVCIGKAQGQNWWCVLFPPMCSSTYIKSTKEDLELLQEYGFDQQLADSLVKTKCKKTTVKFRIFEILR